ncbi:Thioredoxin domain protein [Kalmanozyma brasiliensis GHG001]|uniref:Thioredoxin domain-containing protein n=1 Tax=Kalmanozyma brasiliensis (strain GHG001) TaxID=1365824 RepID=V5GJE2_KALBG|nr:Thioredoxin domain protein [Kalmanozyma brasiliensis GHG001]EST06057.1 Thioredoxin domain protein [Kalmanozyma brasiliensis GHG001]
MLSRALRASSFRALRPASRAFSTTPSARKVYENVDASTFQSRVLSPSAADAETPVLVDFFATWCQPCKLLSPALKKVASNPQVVGGKEVDLVTIDVDQHQDIAQQFKVSAMPTVIAMKNGKVLDGFVGMLPEKKVIEFVQNLK